MRPVINLLNQVFGKLTVVSKAENKGIHSRWNTICECGNTHVAYSTHLKRGNNLSCGCLIGKSNKTHGLSTTPEYNIWCAMKQRCYIVTCNKYKYYGGRAIKVCDRWLHSFPNFLEDMGKRPSKMYSIDRINNDGDYEPENCKWSTQKDQVANQRNTIKLYWLAGNTKPYRGDKCEI